MAAQGAKGAAAILTARVLAGRQGLGIALLALVGCTVVFAPVAGASMLFAPARMEVEVGAAGERRALTIVNKGSEPVWARAYPGEALQQPDGSIRYLDDESNRQVAERFVVIDPAVFVVAPGSYVVLPVRFEPMGERVSYYPVIYVELHTSEAAATAAMNGTQTLGPVSAISRVAVPVLMVNALAEPGDRAYRPVLVDVGARPAREKAELEIWLRLRNDGNVHGDVAGEVGLFEPAGRLVDVVPFHAGRILPGAIREVTVRWPLPAALGQVAVLALVGSGNSAGLDRDRPVLEMAAAGLPPLLVRWDHTGDWFDVSVAALPSLSPQDATSASGVVDVALALPKGE